MSEPVFPPTPLKSLAQDIAALLLSRKESVSVAETACGGLISASLLSVAGASGYYKGGTTVYTLPSRIAFGGWTEENLKGYTGPTPEIVVGLARHTRDVLGSTYAISESGTAGPTGGTTRNRTPGYVALAVVSATGTATREVETHSNDREGNMLAFAQEALKLFLEVLKGDVALEEEEEKKPESSL